jgi:exonuclease SbcC
LKSIELINYRRFKDTLIEFPEGVIGILGLNGVGKSTIIEAIAWAMYGNQPTIVRTTKEDLKRHGAAISDECAVKLEFELAGDKYLITRRMTGKNFQTSAEVSVNGRAEATSTKGVTALIEQRLGMDYQAFYTSVFAKQKELNALSDIEPAKRKSLIIRMLNIDSIDKAIKSVNIDKKELKTRLNENRMILVDQDGAPKIDSYQTQIMRLEDDVKNIKVKIKD